MQVQLFKKVGTYPDKDTGKDKPYTNFYVKCGDALVPVQVCYFPNPKFDNRDPNYNGRKQVLSAFAAILPPKDENGDGAEHKPSAPPPDEDVPAPSDDDFPI